MTERGLGIPQDIKIRIQAQAWSSNRKFSEQKCLFTVTQSTTWLIPGKETLMGTQTKSSRVHRGKDAFLFWNLSLSLFCLFLSISALIWRAGVGKGFRLYTSDPLPPRSNPMLRRLLHSSKGKEKALGRKKKKKKACFYLWAPILPKHTVRFSYAQNGMCRNTNDIHYLIKGSFSFVHCCLVWKAKRNKPWKTKESWRVEHCMSGIKPNYEPGSCHHTGVTSDYNHLQHYSTSPPHTHHRYVVICQSTLKITAKYPCIYDTPSFLCVLYFQDLPCHIICWTAFLLCNAEMTSSALVSWLSADEAPRSQSFEKLMTEYCIRWIPMNTMSIKEERSFVSSSF